VSTAEEIRASLIPIVDRLIRENSSLAHGFRAKFPTRESATQWVSHELGQLSKEIAVVAESARVAPAGPDIAKINAYVEQVIAPALAAALEEIDTTGLNEDDVYEALSNALVQVSQTQVTQ